MILCEGGVIRAEDLPPNVRNFISDKRVPVPVLGDEGLDFFAAVESFERRLIEEAMRRTKGNKQAAAKLLGLKRTTLVAKLQRLEEGAAGALPQVGENDAGEA